MPVIVVGHGNLTPLPSGITITGTTSATDSGDTPFGDAGINSRNSLLFVQGAGAGSTNYQGSITSFNSSSNVTISPAASINVTNAVAVWGDSNAATNGTTTLGIVLKEATQVGDTIAIITGAGNFTFTIADTAANTWTQEASFVDSANNFNLYCWCSISSKASAAGSNTVTLTEATGGNIIPFTNLWYVILRNVDPAHPINFTVTGEDTTGTSASATTPSFSTTRPDVLALFFAFCNDNTVSIAAPLTDLGGNFNPADIGYQQFSSIQTNNTFTATQAVAATSATLTVGFNAKPEPVQLSPSPTRLGSGRRVFKPNPLALPQQAITVLTLYLSGIDDSSALGALSMSAILAPAGVPDSSTPGAATLAPAATASVDPAGIATEELFGSSTSAPSVAPAGTPYLGDFGALQTALGVLPSGVDRSESMGSGINALVVTHVGIDRLEDHGALVNVPTLAPTTVPSEDHFGVSTMGAIAFANPAGIGTEERFGSGSSVPSMAPAGTPYLGDFGALQAALGVLPSGIDRLGEFGSGVDKPTLAPAGVDRFEVFGAGADNPAVAPAGVDRSESMGSGTSALVVTHVGIDRLENHGAPAGVPKMAPSSPQESSLLGYPILGAQVFLYPSGTDTEERFGPGYAIPALAPTTLPSKDVIGASTLGAMAFVNPAGVGTEERFGAGSSVPSLAPSGTPESTGVGAQATLLKLAPYGIATSSDLGAFINAVQFTPAGVNSHENTGSILTSLVVQHSGMASGEATGADAISAYLAPAGVPLLGDFGSLQAALVVTTSSSTSETLGASWMFVAVYPSGSATSEVFGTGTTNPIVLIHPAGTDTGEVVSAGALTPQLQPAGTSSFESAGASWLAVVVSSSGFATLEAMGAGTTQPLLSVTPAGIGTEERVSAGVATPQLQPSGSPSSESSGATWLMVTVAPTGFATLELAGAGTTQPLLTVTPAGIPTAEVVSASGVVSPKLQPAGASSGETLGANLAFVTIAPSGVSTEDRTGPSMLTLSLYQSGVPSTEALGAGFYGLTVAPSGTPNHSELGANLLSLAFVPASTPTGETFGAQTAFPVVVVQPASIPTTEVVNSGTTVPALSTAGIPTGGDVGAEYLSLVFAPAGTNPSEGFGVSVSVPVGLILTPTGTPTEEQVGPSFLRPMVAPSAIPPTEVSGAPQVALGIRTFIESLEASGAAVTLLSVYPSHVDTAESVGAQNAAPFVYASAPTEEKFGAGAMHPVVLVQPASIPSSEVVGGGTAMLYIQPSGTPESEHHGAYVALIKMYASGIDDEDFGLMTVLPVLRISPAGTEPHGGVGYGVALPNLQPTGVGSESDIEFGSGSTSMFITPSGVDSHGGNFGSETLILWAGGTLFPSGTPSLEVIGSAVLSLTRPPPTPPAQPPLVFAKQFRLGYPFALGDLTLYIVDPRTRQPVSPYEITYTMYQVAADGSLVQAGPAGKRPVKQSVGLYYATGIAGENGQPGEWVLRWSYRHFFGGSLVTVDYPFQVVDAISGPVPGDRTPRFIKFGWD